MQPSESFSPAGQCRTCHLAVASGRWQMQRPGRKRQEAALSHTRGSDNSGSSSSFILRSLLCRLAPIVGAGEHAPSGQMADPASARPSLAVGLLGTCSGEHARGPARRSPLATSRAVRGWRPSSSAFRAKPTKPQIRVQSSIAVLLGCYMGGTWEVHGAGREQIEQPTPRQGLLRWSKIGCAFALRSVVSLPLLAPTDSPNWSGSIENFWSRVSDQAGCGS